MWQMMNARAFEDGTYADDPSAASFVLGDVNHGNDDVSSVDTEPNDALEIYQLTDGVANVGIC